MGLADCFYLLCFDDRHWDVTICVMKFHLHNGSDYQTFFQAVLQKFIYLFIYLLNKDSEVSHLWEAGGRKGAGADGEEGFLKKKPWLEKKK